MKRDKRALRLYTRGGVLFARAYINMHLAVLSSIYVSGTGRTNFGNNRTGSDRMSAGCPPGNRRHCPTAATGSVANATHPQCSVDFYHSFSLCPSSNRVAPFVSSFPALPFLYLFSISCFISTKRENAHRPKHRPIFIFHCASPVAMATFNCCNARGEYYRRDDGSTLRRRLNLKTSFVR